MITIDQFGQDGPHASCLFTLRKLDRITGGAEATWEAYFEPDGMDAEVRRLFEMATPPVNLTIAVMMRVLLKKDRATLVAAVTAAERARCAKIARGLAGGGEHLRHAGENIAREIEAGE